MSRIAGWLGVAPRAAARSYDAGMFSRLMASWGAADISENSAIWGSLSAMRARSRSLARNNAYARRFLGMVRSNVAGPDGMILQSRVTRSREWGDKTDGDADEIANALIEAEWNKWARRGSCEITGRLSLAGILQNYVWTMARDGEVLVRLVRGADNRHRFALQLIDPARLDETYNDERPGGNLVRMGVEIDDAGRPVAYWLRKPTRQTFPTWTGERERVSAENLWHDFIAHDAEQIRGVPWMHASMIKLYQLGKFEEAAVIAARVGASKLGVIESPTGEPPDSVASGKDSAGNFLTDAEAGQYWTLPQGYTLKSWDPTYPSETFAPFMQACLRGIASGMDVSYVSLANDLEGVNFSSIRQGVLEEREAWKTLQTHIADGFMSHAVFRPWLETSLLAGALAPLPPAKLPKFDAPSWNCKRWPWVDPLKDREESVLAVDNAMKTRTQVCAEEGIDFEDVVRRLKSEQDLAAKYGVTLPDPNRSKQQPKQDANDGQPARSAKR